MSIKSATWRWARRLGFEEKLKELRMVIRLFEHSSPVKFETWIHVFLDISSKNTESVKNCAKASKKAGWRGRSSNLLISDLRRIAHFIEQFQPLWTISLLEMLFARPYLMVINTFYYFRSWFNDEHNQDVTDASFYKLLFRCNIIHDLNRVKKR